MKETHAQPTKEFTPLSQELEGVMVVVFEVLQIGAMWKEKKNTCPLLLCYNQIYAKEPDAGAKRSKVGMS